MPGANPALLHSRGLVNLTARARAGKRRDLMTSWDVFWFLFLFIPLIILWGAALFDLMGRRDLVGWKKAIWAMVIIFFPWIGVLAYLILRPREMAMAYAGGAAPAASSAPTYTPQTPPSDTPTDQVPSDTLRAMS